MAEGWGEPASHTCGRSRGCPSEASLLLLFLAVPGHTPGRLESLPGWQCAGLDPTLSWIVPKHGGKNCLKCTYARNRPSWKLATRMPRCRAWLKAKPVASTSWGVGCRACRWYCLRSGIPGTSDRQGQPVKLGGCSIQVSNLHRHTRTKIHRLATEALRKGDATCNTLTTCQRSSPTRLACK